MGDRSRPGIEGCLCDYANGLEPNPLCGRHGDRQQLAAKIAEQQAEIEWLKDTIGDLKAGMVRTRELLSMPNYVAADIELENRLHDADQQPEEEQS